MKQVWKHGRGFSPSTWDLARVTRRMWVFFWTPPSRLSCSFGFRLLDLLQQGDAGLPLKLDRGKVERDHFHLPHISSRRLRRMWMFFCLFFCMLTYSCISFGIKHSKCGKKDWTKRSLVPEKCLSFDPSCATCIHASNAIKRNSVWLGINGWGQHKIQWNISCNLMENRLDAECHLLRGLDQTALLCTLLHNLHCAFAKFSYITLLKP